MFFFHVLQQKENKNQLLHAFCRQVKRQTLQKVILILMLKKRHPINDFDVMLSKSVSRWLPNDKPMA